MADTLKDVPEFFESELGESIIARTKALGKFSASVFFFFRNILFDYSIGSFRELGPPDLCHIIKINSKPGLKEVRYEYSTYKYLIKLKG